MCPVVFFGHISLNPVLGFPLGVVQGVVLWLAPVQTGMELNFVVQVQVVQVFKCGFWCNIWCIGLRCWCAVGCICSICIAGGRLEDFVPLPIVHRIACSNVDVVVCGYIAFIEYDIVLDSDGLFLQPVYPIVLRL